MKSAPFLMLGNKVLRQYLQFLGITIIYIMRTKTEELHLSRDPDYMQYALMEQHGNRFIKRLPLLHHLSYRAPLQNVVATPAHNLLQVCFVFKVPSQTAASMVITVVVLEFLAFAAPFISTSPL